MLLNILLLGLIFLTPVSDCTCLIDWEFSGDYETQMTSGSKNSVNINYSQISIRQDSVSVWGSCFEKFDKSLLLRDANGCFRCIRLEKLSPKIVRIWVTEWNRCFTISEYAKLYCPKDDYSAPHQNHLLLFRLSDGFGNSNFTPSLCPFSGRFRVDSQSINNEVGDSVLTTCPKGHTIRVEKAQDPSQGWSYFRGEGYNSISDVEDEWECLGQWNDARSVKSLLLLDLKATSQEAKYRCARVERFSEKDIIMTVSTNSSCPVESDDGALFRLKKLYAKSLPSVVSKGSSCRFPLELRGQWTDLQILKTEIIHRNPKLRQFTTYHCVRNSPTKPDRFLIYVRSSCGQEWYGCLWILPRSPYVLEFQLGKEQSTSPSIKLCSNDQFLKKTWSIGARYVKEKKSSACPVAGVYSGQLPDAPSLCAKLKSDCQNPEIMHYKVTFCHKRHIVYEEREYQCLGQWRDKHDGLLYTYVKRRDLQTYECFVGKINDNGTLHLIESGTSCRRGLRVVKYGMKLHKIQSCPKVSTPYNHINEISDHRTGSKMTLVLAGSSKENPSKCLLLLSVILLIIHVKFH